MSIVLRIGRLLLATYEPNVHFLKGKKNIVRIEGLCTGCDVPHRERKRDDLAAAERQTMYRSARLLIRALGNVNRLRLAIQKFRG